LGRTRIHRLDRAASGHDLRLLRLSPHTYQLNYPAPGAPDLARRVADLIGAAGLPAATTPARGFDHGVFVPFLLIDPEAVLPIVPLSLKRDLDPEDHLRAGAALAPCAMKASSSSDRA
jgi:aromatic ring-opening dioxygenase catalytic subunit (LigB family)